MFAQLPYFPLYPLFSFALSLIQFPSVSFSDVYLFPMTRSLEFYFFPHLHNCLISLCVIFQFRNQFYPSSHHLLSPAVSLTGVLAGAAIAVAIGAHTYLGGSKRIRSRVVGIVAARYASSRFQGKPLVNILGKPMIQVPFWPFSLFDQFLLFHNCQLCFLQNLSCFIW